MPRSGYDSICIERTARVNLSALRLDLSALLGRQLTTSDVVGLLAVMGQVARAAATGDQVETPVGDWISTSYDVWREQRANARGGR